MLMRGMMPKARRERRYDEDQVGGEDSVRVSLHTASVLVALLIEASPSH